MFWKSFSQKITKWTPASINFCRNLKICSTKLVAATSYKLWGNQLWSIPYLPGINRFTSKHIIFPFHQLEFFDLVGLVAWRVSSYFHSSFFLFLAPARLYPCRANFVALQCKHYPLPNLKIRIKATVKIQRNPLHQQTDQVQIFSSSFEWFQEPLKQWSREKKLSRLSRVGKKSFFLNTKHSKKFGLNCFFF